MSYTAPKLSLTDEANELAQVNEAERKQIYRDKYGRDPSYYCDNADAVIIDCEELIDDESAKVNGNIGNNIVRTDVRNNGEETCVEDDGDDADNNSNNAQQQPQQEDEQHGNVDNINNEEDEGQEHNDEESDVSYDIIERFFEELDNIPLGEKLEYAEALVQVPGIVEDESNPLNFIRYCNYDPAAAALSLCEYWKRRIEIFGDEDAYKPMTLQGAGHSIIQTVADLPNYFRILPNDDYGRKVFCADRSHVDFTGKDHMDFVKYFWLVYHDALRDVWTQKNGVVFVLICRGMSNSYLNRKALQNIFSHRLPLKTCCQHFCFSSLSAHMLLPVLKFFMKPEGRRRTELHLSIKTPTILKELKEFGLQAKNLPPSVGGTYNEVPSWVTECRQIIKNERKQRRNQQRHELSINDDRWQIFR